MALLDNLISYWKLDEASGDALDAHGSNDLTDNSTVGSTAGKIGNARDFESSDSEFFSHTTNSDLEVGNIDWSVACWVKPEQVSGYLFIASKDNIGVEREWGLLINQDHANKFSFGVFSGTTLRAEAVWGAAPSADTWYFVAAGHSAASGEVWISVNADTPVTSATSGTPSSSSQAFRIGAGCLGGTPFLFWDGLIDEFAFWKRDVRSDLATLYNGGGGLSYDDWDAGGGGGAIAQHYYPLLLGGLGGQMPC